MNRRWFLWALVPLVLVGACSGGPTAPTALEEPELDITAADIAFVEGTDIDGRVEASGSVAALRFGPPIGVSGRARGRWSLAVATDGGGHRVRGQLSARASTASGQVIGVRARIVRAALRDDGEALRFAGSARVWHAGTGYAARLRGTVVSGGRIRLDFIFRDGGEGQIVGVVEAFAGK